MPEPLEKPVKFQIGATPPEANMLSAPAAPAPRDRKHTAARWLLMFALAVAIAAGTYGYFDLKRRLAQNQFAGSEIEKNIKAFSAQQQQRIDAANAQLATLEKRQTELVETLEKTTVQLAAAQKSLAQKADQTNLAKEASSRKQMEKNLADLQGVDEQLETLNGRIDTISADLKGEMKELSLLLNDTAKSVIDLKTEVDQMAKRSDPDDIRKALQAQLTAVEKQAKETNTSVQRLSGKVNSLASATAEVRQQLARHDGEFIKMKKNLSLYDDTILRLTSQLRNVETHLKALGPGVRQEIIREQPLNQ